MYELDKTAKQLKEILNKAINNIANAFFRSGYIESWGRGITKMTDLCLQAGLPKPSFYLKTSGIWAVFQKDIYNAEHLHTLGLNDRQVKAVLYAKENGSITNAIYQKINGQRNERNDKNVFYFLPTLKINHTKFRKTLLSIFFWSAK